MSMAQDLFEIGRTHGSAVAADVFRWYEERGLDLNLIDKENQIERKHNSFKYHRRKVRELAPQVEEGNWTLVNKLNYHSQRMTELEKDISNLWDEIAALPREEEEPIFVDKDEVLLTDMLRRMLHNLYHKLIKPNTKLYNYAVTILIWSDDLYGIGEMWLGDYLRLQTGASMILAEGTKMPLWKAEADANRKRLLNFLAKDDLRKVIMAQDPGERAEHYYLSESEIIHVLTLKEHGYTSIQELEE